MTISKAKYVSESKMKKIKKLVGEGYISERRDPQRPELAIYNYTKKTQFERRWNDITKACRGLVVDDKRRIVIECPQKFFMQGEAEAPDMGLWDIESTIITEKLDGYYISFRNDSEYGLIVTSRGSFDNQYTDAARPLLPNHIYLDTDYFCELCQNFSGDENLIVTHHKDPRLVLWGVDGEVPAPYTNWHMDVAKHFTFNNVWAYLNKDVEGVVAFNRDTKQRVKIKTEWYLNLHKLISGITLKSTITALINGEPLSQNEHVPEEYMGTIVQWEQRFCNEKMSLITHASSVFNEWRMTDNKQFSLLCNEASEIKSLVLAMRQGKDYHAMAEKFTKRRLLRDTADQKVRA